MVVQDPHRVAEDDLGVQVRLVLVVRGAVTGDQVAQVQRQRRTAVACRVPPAGDLLIPQLGVLDDLEQVQVDARTVDAGQRPVRRQYGRAAGRERVWQEV